MCSLYVINVCTILCVNAVLESKHRELVRQLPEGLQDRYLLGTPEDWIKILKKEGEDMQVPNEAGDRGQG